MVFKVLYVLINKFLIEVGNKFCGECKKFDF